MLLRENEGILRVWACVYENEGTLCVVSAGRQVSALRGLQSPVQRGQKSRGKGMGSTGGKSVTLFQYQKGRSLPRWTCNLEWKTEEVTKEGQKMEEAVGHTCARELCLLLVTVQDGVGGVQHLLSLIRGGQLEAHLFPGWQGKAIGQGKSLKVPGEGWEIPFSAQNAGEGAGSQGWPREIQWALQGEAGPSIPGRLVWVGGVSGQPHLLRCQFYSSSTVELAAAGAKGIPWCRGGWICSQSLQLLPIF